MTMNINEALSVTLFGGVLQGMTTLGQKNCKQIFDLLRELDMVDICYIQGVPEERHSTWHFIMGDQKFHCSQDEALTFLLGVKFGRNGELPYKHDYGVRPCPAGSYLTED